ncbi:MAG: pyrroline-5-carboxylate reductase [Clostridia bacterium]|nr:pyrroline-5-carboxylate reductase [Clostridia bacterium]
MNVGFIGAGNMGGALARAISKDLETVVYIYDKNEEKSSALAEITGGFSSTFGEVIEKSDFLFLGVKPNIIAQICEAIGKECRKDTVIVSMAAGVKILKIEESLGARLPMIRIMPNTPVAVGEGLTAYSKNDLVTSDTEEAFKKIMSLTGTLVHVEESEIDAFCAIAGCGPAYAYMFIEALAKGSEACGIPRDRAIFYASKMIRGSAIMALESGIDPKTLRENVCSPGGATIEGVKLLEKCGFSDSVSSAIDAAYKRTLELGK